jgi:hypothetical protein
MRGRTPQPEAVLLAYRSAALLLAWSLLLPSAPAFPLSPLAPVPSTEAGPTALPPAALTPAQAPAPQESGPSAGPDSLTGKCLQSPRPNDILQDLLHALPPQHHPDRPGDEWGEITVAQPKIWQFDRVSSLLDGLLRDVEGVSLSDLTQLDPNAQNAAAIKFVQSALEVGVQYDQAAALNAQNVLSTFRAQQGSQLQQLNAYNSYLETLTTQRNSLATQLAAATNQVNALQALQATGTATPAQAAELLAAQASVQSLSSSLSTTNTLISGAGAPPSLTSPPTLVGTSVTAPASGSPMSSSLMGFSDVLNNLPAGVKNNLSTALGNPTLPATKRLDNFITLLYERLAREVSVLQDDLMRDPENEAFLLQFDVGLYPSKRATDHVARVEFDLNCPGCKIYSLYPGMSAYNIANYTGSSKRTTLWGNVLTLLGFGLSASYRRQVDTLQGGLIQSVYTAGFQNGVLDTAKDYSREDKGLYSGKESAAFARQSFGWYYGQAPTEKVVTPGIRTTFAMLTVPRDLIQNTRDGFGNMNACLAFDINGAWARRDNPTLQHAYVSGLGDAAKILAFPGYYPEHYPLYNHDDEKSYVYKRASVKLPAAPDDVPLVARRERQKLHVIRMEYNTVYAPPPEPASTPPPTSTTVSTSSNSTASPMTSTSTSSTGTSTTTTTTTTTSSAPSDKSATPPPAAPPTYANLYPLPCPKYECSAMLIRLDRPIDPNLVVTVNGLSLQRVRDWRGRATSILPAAQSGSDLSAQAAASGTTFSKQLQDGRSLLESDKFEANSWFPLNSRDLLLNVSKSVATEEEFPIIQVAEPGGTVTIPYDLETSTTELLINRFHIKPQTNSSITEGILKRYATDTPPPPAIQSAAPLWSGPYAPSTYAPLFGAEPTPKKFYVQVGLTGEDILVGFLPDHPSRQAPCGQGPTGNSPCSEHFNFSEAHTQVILEDSELDFAWSLPCYVQDEQLACHFPRHQIARAYQGYLQACEADQSGKCPALDDKYEALRAAFGQLVNPVRHHAEIQNASDADQTMLRAYRSYLQACEPDPSRNCPTVDEKREVLGQAAGSYLQPCKDGSPRKCRTLDEEYSFLERAFADELQQKLRQTKLETILPRAFVTSTQLWVEQFDPEGQQHFYSAEPTKIDFLPLSDAFWHPLPKGKPVSLSLIVPSIKENKVIIKPRTFVPTPEPLEPLPPTLFRPWHLTLADSEKVTVEGCNYTPDVRLVYKGQEKAYEQSPLTQPSVTMLGSGFSNVADWLHLPPSSKDSKANPDTNCGTFTVPTSQLANESVVFVLTLPPLKPFQESDDGKSGTNPPTPPKQDKPGDKAAISESKSDSNNQPINVVMHLATSRLKPSFGKPRIVPVFSRPGNTPGAIPDCAPNPDASSPADKSKSEDASASAKEKVFKLACWDIYLPASRLASGDKFEIPDNLQAAGFDYFWPPWAQKNQAVPQPLPDEVSLHLKIKRAALPYLPASLQLLRYWGGSRIPAPVATLPNLGKLLLPTRVKLIAINDHQFALQGENAGLIDAITVSSGDKATTVPVAASGSGFVLASFTAPSAKSKDDTSSQSGGTENSSNITVVDGSASSKVTINKQNKSTPMPKPQTTPPAPSDKTSTPSSLDPGSYAVTPLLLVGSTVDSKKAADSDAAAKEEKAAAKALSDAKAAVAKAKPEEIAAKKTLQKKAQDAADAAKAKAQQAEKDAAPVPNYMPLDVTDEKGGPLIFVVPEPKKSSAPSTPTPQTCTAPCAVPLCATTGCPPTPKPTTTP